MRKRARTVVGGRSQIPTWGLVVACLCLDARARALADGFRGGMTVATRVDDGFATPENQAGWVNSWTPFAQWYSLGTTASLDIAARRRYDSVPGSLAPRQATDVAKAAASSRSGATTTWKLDGRFQKTRDLISLDPQAVASAGVIEVGEAATFLGVSRAEAGWSMRSTTRLNPGEMDGWSQAATASILPMRSPTSVWLVQGRYQDWTLDREEALRVLRLTTGYRRQHTPQVSTEAQIGIADVQDPLDPSAGRSLAWSVAASGFARTVGVPLESSLHISGDVATTGSMDLGRDISDLSLTLHAERSIEAEGGAFTTPAIKDFAAFALADTFSGDWMAALEASYARTRPRIGEGPRVDATRTSFTLAHRFQNWLVTHVAYAYLGHVETQAQQVDRSHRGRVEIGLTASFR